MYAKYSLKGFDIYDDITRYFNGDETMKKKFLDWALDTNIVLIIDIVKKRNAHRGKLFFFHEDHDALFIAGKMIELWNKSLNEKEAE